MKLLWALLFFFFLWAYFWGRCQVQHFFLHLTSTPKNSPTGQKKNIPEGPIKVKNFKFQFRVSISSFKFQFEVSISSFDFKFQFHVSISSFSLMFQFMFQFQFQVSVSVSCFSFKFPVSSFKFQFKSDLYSNCLNQSS